MSKPRACETEVVESLHPDLAPVGQTCHVTPEEARFLLLVGRARRPVPPPGEYANREMRTSRGNVARGKRK